MQKTKKTHEERLKICQKCPKYSKFWKTCKICHCFMPLKTKLRWAECPDEPPRWTQEKEYASTLWNGQEEEEEKRRKEEKVTKVTT